MSKTITSDPATDEPIDYEAAIDLCLAETDELLKKMKTDREETERLREETWAILERLKAV